MTAVLDNGLRHIEFVADKMKGCDRSTLTMAVLFELDIPTNQLGFDYLLNAIVVFSKNPYQTLRTGIYPAAAACYEQEVSSEEMEQAIRAVIKKAWKNKIDDDWKHYFSPNANGIIKKPTNSEFISKIGRVVQYMRQYAEREAGNEE